MSNVVFVFNHLLTLFAQFPELADELNEDTSPSDKGAVMLHTTLQQYVDREAERRDLVLKAAQEEQRLEDQRVYREQLGKEGDKRKARRRRKRLEAQQRRNLPPVQALDSETERDEGHSSRISTPTNQSEGLLLWEKKTMVSRPSSVVSGRPRWVARKIHCTQQSQQESEHDFMDQCTKLHETLEKEHSRRRSVRAIVTAPTTSSRREFPSQLRPETASF
ncbi:hypothetical protein DVH05_019611 [Phytophthora capsici]|nr:hypothetical protein DVH05_019611 [Phytophthora capsici]